MIKPDGEDMAKLTAMGDDVVKQGAKEGRKIAGDTPNTIDSEKIIKEKFIVYIREKIRGLKNISKNR